MERKKVYVIHCSDYAQAAERLRAVIGEMGGMERFVRPGERILLKANLLRPAPPEAAICTHPAVVEAVASLVKEAGGTAVIADSPGGALQKESVLRNLYAKTGMEQAAANAGAEVSCDASTRLVTIPGGKRLKQAEIIAPAAEADGIIDLCKLKTHVFIGMTGAVKNFFGLIPGLAKVGFHGSHPDRLQFADVLLDLTAWARPRLCIMDGILAMEGEGPGASGTPRQVGLLLVSEDPLALDVVAAELIGLPRKDAPVLLAAQARGLTPNCLEDVELIGGEMEQLRISDYRLPANVRSNLMEFLGPLQDAAGRLCQRILSQAPKIDKRTCIGCGICKNACPGKAISMTGPHGTAKIAPGACIRCYCCHELCPQQAVALKRGLFGRLLK